MSSPVLLYKLLLITSGLLVVFGKECRLDKFVLQPDFDADQYQGYWYGISINRYWFQIPVISSLFTQKNVQAHYQLLPDGNIEIKTGGSFFMGYCDHVSGTGIVDDKNQPQKLHVHFNTWLTRAARDNPYWVVKTDYTGYAAIYSCWKVLDNGTCDPDYAYMWTINRKASGHTPEELEEIYKAAESVCIEPGNFKPILQDGHCIFDPDNFTQRPNILTILASIILVSFIFLVYFCCCSSTKKHYQVHHKKRH